MTLLEYRAAASLPAVAAQRRQLTDMPPTASTSKA
jgi:hypothetical protein